MARPNGSTQAQSNYAIIFTKGNEECELIVDTGSSASPASQLSFQNHVGQNNVPRRRPRSICPSTSSGMMRIFSRDKWIPWVFICWRCIFSKSHRYGSVKAAAIVPRNLVFWVVVKWELVGRHPNRYPLHLQFLVPFSLFSFSLTLLAFSSVRVCSPTFSCDVLTAGTDDRMAVSVIASPVRTGTTWVKYLPIAFVSCFPFLYYTYLHTISCSIERNRSTVLWSWLFQIPCRTTCLHLCPIYNTCEFSPWQFFFFFFCYL